MTDPAPTAAILSELVRTHKHDVRLFNEYHAIGRACNKVISKLIPKKFYKSLSSRIIGFVNVTSLEILTHLISEYAELEEEDIQEIDRKIKEPISGETWISSSLSSAYSEIRCVRILRLVTSAKSMIQLERDL